MRHLVLFLLLCALTACEAKEERSREPVRPSAEPILTIDPATGKRLCRVNGGFSEEVCRYRLDEIPTITGDAAIMVRGYLYRDTQGFFITSERDGRGDRLRTRLDNARHGRGSEAYTSALLGYLVNLRGIYHPAEGVIETRSLGYIDEPGIPRPDLPEP